jgi:hypothetical protein
VEEEYIELSYKLKVIKQVSDSGSTDTDEHLRKRLKEMAEYAASLAFYVPG